MAIIDNPRKRVWHSIRAPGRGVSIRFLRALAYDLHGWRATLVKLRDAYRCDVDDLLVRTDALIVWVTAEQAQALIDRVACTADRA
jgi:hypothetical protein